MVKLFINIYTTVLILLLNNEQYFKEKHFNFIGYNIFKLNLEPDADITSFYCKIPVHVLRNYLNLKELQELSILHKIPLPHNVTKKTILTYFDNHYCNQCDIYVSVLQEKKKKIKIKIKTKTKQKSDPIPLKSIAKFPPNPPSTALIETIIRGLCNDTKPDNLTEAGCAVYGQVSSLNNMVLLNDLQCDLYIISPGNIDTYEHLNNSDPILPLNGPILAENCKHVCQSCQSFLQKGIKPPQSLSNSFWIGPFLTVLKNLTFAEKMLIARIHHNKCIIHVFSGHA